MTDAESATWYSNVVPASTESTAVILRDLGIIEDFYLAGGTGLALQYGHRLSRDLDFFSQHHFDEEILLQKLQSARDFSLLSRAPHTLHATLGETKVSFLGYEYPVLFPFGQFLGLAIADVRDIACMKISAVAGRGTKRDFVDLYFCARQLGLTELLSLFEQKYAQVHYSKTHILKSLVFFADAEKDPMPLMLEPVAWDEIKQYFLGEVPRILRLSNPHEPLSLR
jgi:hypothetical protein